MKQPLLPLMIGYLPTLGATKTKRALDLLEQAGVEPVFHGEESESA